MNWNRLLNFLGLVLCGCALGCGYKVQIESNEDNSSFPPTKYKIDGNFDDWKTYQTVKTSTGIDWSNVVMTGFLTNAILLKEFYYDNDSNYLYLFFKFKPSFQERYDRTHEVPFGIGDLYFDTDLNTNTGCTDLDTEGTSPPPGVPTNEWRSGESTIPGSEIRVCFPTGFYSNPDSSGWMVSYKIMLWDSTAKTFIKHVVQLDSRTTPSLITFGKDGVEAALLLTDLQLTRTNKFALTYWDTVISTENLNREIVQLK